MSSESEIVEQLIESLASAHCALLETKLARIDEMAQEAASANPDIEELLLLRHRVRIVGDEVRRICDREENGLFSMIRRLHEARLISRCHAGMVAARVRFTVMDQEAVLQSVQELRALAAAPLSPRGPCALCHPIVEALDELRADLLTHFTSEREMLFAPAVERETRLAEVIQ